MGVVAVGLVSSLDEASVTVVCRRREACGSCAQKDGCAVATVSGLRSKDVTVTLPRPCDMALTVGQLVALEVQERMLASGILLMLVVPLLFLLLGVFAGACLDADGGETWQIAGAAAGLILGLLAGRFASMRLVGAPKYRLRPYEMISCHRT